MTWYLTIAMVYVFVTLAIVGSARRNPMVVFAALVTSLAWPICIAVVIVLIIVTAIQHKIQKEV